MKLRISLLLAVAVLINSQFMLAEGPREKSPEQVRAEVVKRGTGEKARVKVKLRNAPEVRGYISKVEESSFEVRQKSGESIIIPYADVVRVQKPGMSKGLKIGIAAGATAAVLLAAAIASATASLGP